MTAEKTIKEALKEGKVRLGKDTTMDMLRKGELSSVFFARNCPKKTVNELSYYEKVSGVDVSEFDGNSAKLGQLCAKPFNVSVLGIKKK